MCIRVPLPLNEHPFAWTSPDFQLLRNVLSDTYLTHVCSLHPTVNSPCPCGEPLNQTARDLFPLNSFDPLNINPKPVLNQKTCSILVGTIILVLALTESVSPHGIFIEISNEYKTKNESKLILHQTTRTYCSNKEYSLYSLVFKLNEVHSVFKTSDNNYLSEVGLLSIQNSLLFGSYSFSFTTTFSYSI